MKFKIGDIVTDNGRYGKVKYKILSVSDNCVAVIVVKSSIPDLKVNKIYESESEDSFQLYVSKIIFKGHHLTKIFK